MGKLRDPVATNIAFAKWMLEEQSEKAIDWIVRMTNQTPDEVAALLNATANFLDYREVLISISQSLPLWCVVREDQQKSVADWCKENLYSYQLSAFGEHMMFWEQSSRFNALLLEFLRSSEESPA